MFIVTVVAFILVPVGLLVIMLIQRRLSAQDPAVRPMRLFWDAGKAASLDVWDRLLLIRAVRCAQVVQPTAILISPSYYDRVVATWLKASHGEGTDRLQRIRRRLFGPS
jgi:hypothetical protein